MSEQIVQAIMREINPAGASWIIKKGSHGLYDRYWRRALRRQAVRILRLATKNTEQSKNEDGAIPPFRGS